MRRGLDTTLREVEQVRLTQYVEEDKLESPRTRIIRRIEEEYIRLIFEQVPYSTEVLRDVVRRARRTRTC